MVFSPKNLLLFFVTYPSFYSEILVSQGNHWFPCFVLWLTEPVLCPSLGMFYFLFFHSFLLFSFDSFESPWLVTYFGMWWGMPFSISTFGSSPFLPFFPSGRNPNLPFWKSPVAIPLFIILYSGSPRCFPLAPWEVAGYFLFLCWVFWHWWLLLCFLFSFLVLFFRTVLIFLLTVLICLEGSAPPGSCWGSWLFFFNLLPWISFPSWCFFF